MSNRKPSSSISTDPKPVAELLRTGTPRWLLYGNEREHPIHGVVMRRSSLPSFDKQVSALATKMSPGQFFSRRTAARMHGLPVAHSRHPEKVDLGAIRPARPLRRPEVRGHQLRENALTLLPDTPNWLPTVEDAWCLLAQVASKAELLAAGDFILSGPSRFDEPLSTLAGLESAVRRFRRCAGAQLRTQVLPLVRTGVESPAESELRLMIVEAGLEEPQTCCPIQVAGRILHADLGYPELKIAVESEGAHHFGKNAIEQARRDITRVRAMQAAGWAVMRVTVHDLRRPQAFLSELAGAILDRKHG